MEIIKDKDKYLIECNKEELLIMEASLCDYQYNIINNYDYQVVNEMYDNIKENK